MIRLDKYLADMGVGTRTEVKAKIRKGLVFVDGSCIKKPEVKIEPDAAVTVEGKMIRYAACEYYLLHKPAGVISATRDARQKTVMDLIDSDRKKDLFPVGRLDKDTEGLLIITNDGDLAHRLLSPRKHVDKRYYAEVRGRVTEQTVEAFALGVEIGTREHPEQTLPARLEILKAGENSKVMLTIQEGKFHQVKRMFLSQGMEVTYLRREAMGTLTLDKSLKAGDYRSLTKEEVEMLG